VGLAQALLHEPPVLILDEPTAGLDPNQISDVRGWIAELKDKHTILLSSHILPEVERIADQVIVIAGGRIAAQGTPADLRQQLGQGQRIVLEAQSPASTLQTKLAALPGVVTVQAHDADGWSQAIITPTPDADPRQAIGQALLQANITIREMRFDRPSLETFFMAVTTDEPKATQAEKSPDETQGATAS